MLDIPFAWRNGFRITGAFTTQFMFGQFYQTVHHRPLLQGNTSRNPEFKFQYFTNAPIINSLLALETGKPLPLERWEADRAVAAEVLRFFDVKYIVVRPDMSDNPIVTPQATIPYIEDLFPVEKIHDSPDIKIYRVNHSHQQTANLQATTASTPAHELSIKTDSPLAPLYFGEGWGLLSSGQPIAAQRQQVRLMLPINNEASTVHPQRLTLSLRLPEAYQGATQTVSVSLNGWQSAAQTLTHEWAEYTFDIPATAIQPGLNDVWLNFSHITTLPQLQPGTAPVDVTVISAGEEVGGFGHIFVNGYDLSTNERGYNIAILTAEGAQVANFDTHFDSNASLALAEFTQAAPAKALVAVAAADEASQNLSEQAVLALQQTTGGLSDMRGCRRCSQVILRTTDGSIMEGFDSLQPVGVTTGLGLTEPNIAALVDKISLKMILE